MYPVSRSFHRNPCPCPSSLACARLGMGQLRHLGKAAQACTTSPGNFWKPALCRGWKERKDRSHLTLGAAAQVGTILTKGSLSSASPCSGNIVLPAEGHNGALCRA